MKLDMCSECGMNAPSCYSIVGRVPARCCSNCTHADAQELYSELLPLRAREPLVQEVIRLRRRQYRIPITRDQELKLAIDLYDAIDKLAEWKP